MNKVSTATPTRKKIVGVFLFLVSKIAKTSILYVNKKIRG